MRIGSSRTGVSFGGYWATKLAITEHGRLLGVVAQSPPVDTALHADFLRHNLLGNREYLFDVVPAFLTWWKAATRSTNWPMCFRGCRWWRRD